MEILVYLIILIVIAIFAIFFHSNEISKHSQRIRKKLEEQGGHRVDVHLNWLLGTQGAYSFDVSFSNGEGERFSTKCTVNRSTYDIFWIKNPSELLLKDDSNAQTDKNPNKETVNSSKEELINDLYLENQKLKEQISRMQDEGSNKE